MENIFLMIEVNGECTFRAKLHSTYSQRYNIAFSTFVGSWFYHSKHAAPNSNHCRVEFSSVGVESQSIGSKLPAVYGLQYSRRERIRFS